MLGCDLGLGCGLIACGPIASTENDPYMPQECPNHYTYNEEECITPGDHGASRKTMQARTGSSAPSSSCRLTARSASPASAAPGRAACTPGTPCAARSSSSSWPSSCPPNPYWFLSPHLIRIWMGLLIGLHWLLKLESQELTLFPYCRRVIGWIFLVKLTL